MKLTGKIVDVVVKEIPQYSFIGESTGPIEYRITRFYDGENYYRYDELDFEVETFIYWEKLEHQYAGMAMQGMLANPDLLEVVTEKKGLTKKEYADKVACIADIYATALVEKLKNSDV